MCRDDERCGNLGDGLWIGSRWATSDQIASKIRLDGRQKQMAQAVLRARLAVVEPEPGSKPNQ
jgi:hypothetical protein